MWPGGEARKLRDAHNPFFNEAMMDLQRWVPCLKQYNVSIWEFDNTDWHNARTVVNAPFGKVRKVFTVAGGTESWRDEVRYRSTNFDDIECWSRELMHAATPDGDWLSLGFKHADESQDSPVGRARMGVWAIDRRRLYVAPYIQSDERLIVVWDGDKGKWQDSDGVDEQIWGIDEEAAIKLYVLWKHTLFFERDRAQAKALEEQYREKLADIIHKCREYTQQQEDISCAAMGTGGSPIPTSDQTDDDDDPTDDDPTDEDNVLFVQVGDMGLVTTDSTLLAAKVQSDNPELLIAAGDLSYGGSGDYAADFGTNYGWAVDAGIVLAIPGNHDWDASNLAPYHEYFPVTGGRNYYEYVIGSVHFFVIDSDPREPDGRTSSSKQAEWLRLKALLSPARWKVVVMHHPPFSSGTNYGSQAVLQWAFADWGIDVVLCAHEHDYERIVPADGVTYIVNGLGGVSAYNFSTPITGSHVRYNAKAGRLIGQANCDQMILTFKNIDDVVIDTVTLTKE